MRSVSDWEPGWGYPAVVDAERPEPSTNGGTDGGAMPPGDGDATPPPAVEPTDDDAPQDAPAPTPEVPAFDTAPSAGSEPESGEADPPQPSVPEAPPEPESGEADPPQASVTEAPPEPDAPPFPEVEVPVSPAEGEAAAVAETEPAEIRRAETALPPPPARRGLPRTLAIANQKGGVGKTTTAVNLGAGLADLGYRVLVVDLDPQGNATTGLGINARNLNSSVYDVLLADAPLEDCVEPTSVRNLFVVPATIDLAGAEIELVPAFSRELKLRRAVDRLDGDFDFTLIDCPPSLGLLTVNGLAAAGEVLVPIQCEYYALEGLGQLMRNIQLVQSNLNPRLELTTIVLTMFDARTKLADQVAREVRSHFGSRVCRTIVPRTVRLSEAPSFGQPIIVFDPSSRGAIAYRELAKEVSGGAPGRAG
jgi:chromosome partitioning protein